MRVPTLADGRDVLLVAGALTVMFGVVTAGLGLVGPEPLPQETAAGSSPLARTILLGPAASPLTVGDTCRGGPACHPDDPLAARPGTPVIASGDDDRGQYLSKMAALRHRRRVTSVDPYQASLNPAVYLASAATPIDDEDSAAR